MKRIVIFGAGKFGMRYSAYVLKYSEDKIICFLDNSRAKQGTQINELNVFEPKKILELDYDAVVIAVSGFEDEILQQLKELNIDETTINFASQHIEVSDIQTAEIEIFSYCNRQCWFCPNSIIDRHSENIYMLEDIYLSILNQLASINKKIKISYSRYNEPLSNKIIFLKRLTQAKEILPEARLHTNTNGDYLNREYLDELCSAGLNSLNIQSYLTIDECFDIEKIKNKISQISNNLGFNYIEEINQPDYYSVVLPHKSMNIRLYARDFRINGCTRGNSINTIERHNRNKPCLVPLKDIYIDYNGSVMPCCNFRSDVKEHKKFIMGNVNENTIAEIFCNDKYIWLRKHLCKNNIDIVPCNECKFGV